MSKMGKLLISILALASILFPPPVHATSSVSFVDQGVWVVDGERFFPLILYWGAGPQNEEATWAKMKQAGLNSTITGISGPFFNFAGQNNIKIMASFSQGSFDLQTTITYWKNDSSLIAWYGWDEPCLFPNYSAEVRNRHERIHSELDPDHPIYVYNGCISNLAPAFDLFADVVGSGIHAGGTGATNANEARALHGLVANNRVKSAIVHIPSPSDENKTLNYLKFRILAAIAGGANGISWFDYSCDGFPEHNKNGTCDYKAHFGKIATIAALLNQIKPGLVGSNPLYGKQGDVYVMRRLGTDGLWYLLAVNTHKSLSEKYSVEGFPPNTTFQNIESNKSITSSSTGTLTETIEADSSQGLDSQGLGYRIYRQASSVPTQIQTPSPSHTPTPTPTPTVIPGDLDHDNDVDNEDWLIMKRDFGKTRTPGWIQVDIIINGKVDLFDYNILVGNFGR